MQTAVTRGGLFHPQSCTPARGRGIADRARADLKPAVRLTSWLTQKDLDHYGAEFTHAGFRGAINLYRNQHRNWEITPGLTGKTIPQPVYFIVGAQDAVIRGANETSCARWQALC